ncbi:MAG: hypothetical protein QOE65_2634 [Solirubrobacteraceae bacterium]|nr:hypothetical protein [Solirubrobacteraceae bacterium]
MAVYLTLRERGVLTLPADVRRRHKLDAAGAQVELTERPDGVIELRPQVAVPADQAWFWDERWQEGEREVDRHVERGEVAVHADGDELLAHLDSLGE